MTQQNVRRMKWSFDLPLDDLQRRTAQQVLREAGAPFDPDAPDFSDHVRRVWGLYQAQLVRLSTRRLDHRVDRALFQRKHEEYIDNVHESADERENLIQGLDKVNRAVLAYRWFYRALEHFVRQMPGDECSVLDIGSGHGAFAIRLARRKRMGGKRVRVVGSDLNPDYVQRAQEEAEARGVDIEFKVLDALALHTLPERFDVITSTQTIHHFQPAMLARVIASAQRNARHGVVFLDARRSPLTLLGAMVGTSVLGRDRKLVHDGVVSVRRMYSPAELEMLAACAPGGERLRATNLAYAYVVLAG